MSRVYTQHRCLYPYGFKLFFEVTRRQQPKYFQRQENILPGISLLKQTNLVSYPVSLRTCLPMQEMEATQVWSLGWEGPLEKSMASHSTILAWRIPWTEEPGGLQSIGLQRAGHNWRDLARVTSKALAGVKVWVALMEGHDLQANRRQVWKPRSERRERTWSK